MELLRGMLPALAVMILLPLMVAWINRPKTNEPRILVYGAGMMAFWLIGGGAFMAAGLAMVFGVLPGRGTDVWWVQAIFLGFGTLTLCVALDGLTRRLRWDDQGLAARKYLEREKHHIWEDVTSVTFNAVGSYWVIRFADGTGFSFSEFMRGAHEFLRTCHARGLIAASGDETSGPAQ
jgi:hypothetical protein